MEQQGEGSEFDPHAYIERHWEAITTPLRAEYLKPLAHGILDATLAVYASEGRAYHNARHIADCLQKLEPYQQRGDYQQLWLALLWHDFVYDPEAHDNEARSADWARQKMHWLSLPGAKDVHRLIMSTAAHEPKGEDEALICDIDMSILAAPTERYEAYAAAIRQEYRHVPDEEYRMGRAKVLSEFTQPFHHPDFMHLNGPALGNMSAEITALASKT